MNKIEQEGIISRVGYSVRATPIVVVMKVDGHKPCIFGDYRLTLIPRLRRCVDATMEPEDFMEYVLECRLNCHQNPSH